MEFYTAPLEGITGRVFRNTLDTLFGEATDKYFTPFFMPHEKRRLDKKDMRELEPSKNHAWPLVPQILTNRWDEYLFMEEGMHAIGFEEVNINIGCPSNTVVNKGRGAGFLSDLQELDYFLDQIFDHSRGEISVKTRIGRYAKEEWPALLEIYNRYPIKELIIHPRTGKEKYSGTVHMDCFLYALEYSKNPLVYNGDINSLEDYHQMLARIEASAGRDKLKAIMVGRGLIANPALIRELKGGKKVTGQELFTFLKLLRANYMEASEVYRGKLLLDKMKEIWSYMNRSFHGEAQKEAIALLQISELEEYLAREEEFLSNLLVSISEM